MLYEHGELLCVVFSEFILYVHEMLLSCQRDIYVVFSFLFHFFIMGCEFINIAV